MCSSECHHVRALRLQCLPWENVLMLNLQAKTFKYPSKSFTVFVFVFVVLQGIKYFPSDSCK